MLPLLAVLPVEVEPPLARSFGIISSPMTCSSFEMHSLFMLVRRSWASVRSDSCMLLGSRTVMTRVGSLSPSAEGASRGASPAAFGSSRILRYCSKAVKLVERRERLADDSFDAQHFAKKGHPVGALAITGFGGL